MKIMAINSSARTGIESKTEMMLDSLVAGMREAGAEVNVVELRKKKINYCIGCFTCWTKTPGRCVHNDDMTKELYPMFIESDLAVLATPLYHFTVNAQMKTFIERTLPVLEPHLIEGIGDRTTHPLRAKHPLLAVLSVAGFPEMAVFDQLSAYLKFIYREALVAEIYRPGAESLAADFFQDQRERVLAATREAGYELARNLKIPAGILARVQEPTESGEEMFAIANMVWDTCIAEGVTPREFVARGLTPRPNSIDTFLKIMSMGFNPDGAGDTKASIQFVFSGDQAGACHLIVDQGKIQTGVGEIEHPDITIHTPFDVWMDITTNKVDGQQAFMEQKYQVDGDLNVLLKFQTMFGRH